MVYDAKNAKELDGRSLPKDTILDGVITHIQDGKIKDFVKDAAKWENPESDAIDLEIEMNTGDSMQKMHQLFTYILSHDGRTSYTKSSNLGKYKIKYGKLPEVGDQLKIVTDGNGYGKVKLN
jgi:hypothetical protein